ncbi:MAG: type I 3-dehydroquinate dehydratase [Methanohalobium sp.]|uniref:type I 3-dehydroquinate dehydratase n=1 Tax=Methanohalobium sp. TaxID=2837493 RepID=UPI00397C6669
MKNKTDDGGIQIGVSIGEVDLQKKTGIVASIGGEPVDSSITAKQLGADILEIRFDLLNILTSEDAWDTIEKIRSKVNLPFIATLRSREEGGNWSGTERDRINLLLDIIPSVDAVDIELSAPEKNWVIKSAGNADVTVIVSSHKFTSTPSVKEMYAVLDRCHDSGADIAKLAMMPETMQDVLDMLQVTIDFPKPISTISMGELGKHSRIISPCYGSVLTYGSVTSAVAPGQLRIDKLKECMEMVL